MQTKLLCLDDTYNFENESRIIKNGKDERGDFVVLEESVFYPQGGGQPADRGTITTEESKHSVTGVFIVDDEVRHYVSLPFEDSDINKIAKLEVDREFRLQNTKNHSAGHLLGFAAQSLIKSLIPTKGYHFPEGPYVEFKGVPDDFDKESFTTQLKDELKERVDRDDEIKSFDTSKDKLDKVCTFVPEYIPEGKPIRVMQVREEGYPCGGTHVKTTGEIGAIEIRKIKVSKGILRVSYLV